MKKEEKVLDDYAKVQLKIDELEAKKESLKPQVISYLEKRGDDTLQREKDTFFISYRRKWEYSPTLVEKDRQYKEIIKNEKKEEEDRGIANVVEENKILSYKPYVPKIKEV